ncbi:hypothetical protein MHBO_002296 [Bonamia ostreae]|uniref:Uncharacterized protein n=1 Tax=Bonamia ostreae TaxID=126728 RepID=A0ABV2ALZ4_9EUKA
MNGTRALDSNTDSKIVYNGNKERHSFLQENISQIYASARLIEKSMLLDETFLDDYPPESRAKLSTSEFTNDKFETENIKIPSNIAAKITDNKINSVCGLAPFFPLAWFACDEKFVLWSFTERKFFCKKKTFPSFDRSRRSHQGGRNSRISKQKLII